MRTELLASSQSGRSIDADAWCERALSNATSDNGMILVFQTEDKKDNILPIK